MASDRPDKKEKKEKKEKRSEDAGVTKSKKDKKEKKEKKDKLASALDEKLQQDVAAQSAVKASDEGSDMEEDKTPEVTLERKVVPFAVPLADEKGQKKICKTIRKGRPPLPLCVAQSASFFLLFFTFPSLLLLSSIYMEVFGSCLLTSTLFNSCQEWYPQAWCQGSRQDPAKVPRHRPRLHLIPRSRHHRR